MSPVSDDERSTGRFTSPEGRELLMQALGTAMDLEQRLGDDVAGLRLPATVLQRLAEVVGSEPVQLVTGDVRPLGFGAYDGQLCLVTPTRVVLATATRLPGPEAAFGVEQWDRQVAALPRFVPVRPRAPLADES